MNGMRRGFTLIEMLWVIFIITILISLLLPAVQSSREQVRRAQCANNLLQFSLAARSYETTHRVYPPGVVDTAGPIFHAPSGYHASWIVQLLPYLEKKNFQYHLRPELSIYHPANSTAISIPVYTFNCPSDGGGFIAPNGNRIPVSSYAACHSGLDERIDANNNGVFFLNSHVSDDDILDGLASTIFFGEKLVTAGQLGWASGTRATLRNMGYDLNKSPEVAAGRSGLTSSPFEDPESSDEPGAATPTPSKLVPGRTGGFSSYHPTGANFAFGDGSVRFIKTTVNREIYRRLGQRNDGGLISEGSF